MAADEKLVKKPARARTVAKKPRRQVAAKKKRGAKARFWLSWSFVFCGLPAGRPAVLGSLCGAPQGRMSLRPIPPEWSASIKKSNTVPVAPP